MGSIDLEKKLGLKGKTVKLDDATALTIVNEGVNKLLNRLEVDVHIDHVFSGTPSKTTLRSAIAKVYGVPEDVVVVESVASDYGVGCSKAHVHIYGDAQKMRRIELEHILKRNKITA